MVQLDCYLLKLYTYKNNKISIPAMFLMDFTGAANVNSPRVCGNLLLLNWTDVSLYLCPLSSTTPIPLPSGLHFPSGTTSALPPTTLHEIP